MKTSETSEPLDEKTSSEDTSVILAEYNNLRAELLKRIEIKHQITSLALIAPGTIIAVGLQTKNAFLLFSYPLLACFLSGVWIANTRAYHEIGIYIRKYIEPKLGRTNLGWQHFHHTSSLPFRLVGVLSSGAIFIFTELLALLAGVTITSFSKVEIVLLIFAILSILLNIIMVIQLETRRGKIK